MPRTVEKLRSIDPEPLADLAAMEQVVAEVLVERSLRCACDQGLDQLVMVGGVAANRRLRSLMTEQAEALNLGVTIAPLEFCTDNAAMIGAAALARLARTATASSLEIGVAPRWPLDQADDLYKTPPPF